MFTNFCNQEKETYSENISSRWDLTFPWPRFPWPRLFDDLNKNYAPTKFIFSKNQDCLFYCNLRFNQYSQCSKFIMTIKIDKKLYVQLHVSSTGPSSPMVCSMKKVNLTRFSPLLNFLLLNFLSQLKIYVISSIEAITQRIFIPCDTSIKSTMWVLVLWKLWRF